MEKKQSSVDWFVDQLENSIELYPSEFEKIIKIKEQAKQMHKEEIEDAWDKRCSYGVVSQTWRVETTNGEQYYNETYNNENTDTTT